MGALPLKLQDAFFKPAAVQQMNQAPPVQPQTAGEAVAEGIHQRGEIKAFLHGKPPWRGSLPEEGREGKGKWNRVKCPGRKALGRTDWLRWNQTPKAMRFRPVSGSGLRSTRPSRTVTTSSQVALITARFRCPPQTRPSSSPMLMWKWP